MECNLCDKRLSKRSINPYIVPYPFNYKEIVPICTDCDKSLLKLLRSEAKVKKLKNAKTICFKSFRDYEKYEKLKNLLEFAQKLSQKRLNAKSLIRISPLSRIQLRTHILRLLKARDKKIRELALKEKRII